MARSAWISHRVQETWNLNRKEEKHAIKRGITFSGHIWARFTSAQLWQVLPTQGWQGQSDKEVKSQILKWSNEFSENNNKGIWPKPLIFHPSVHFRPPFLTSPSSGDFLRVSKNESKENFTKCQKILGMAKCSHFCGKLFRVAYSILVLSSKNRAAPLAFFFLLFQNIYGCSAHVQKAKLWDPKLYKIARLYCPIKSLLNIFF